MKSLGTFLFGVLFGIVMVKSEAISWFRIQEMFRFQSFHMYGIMGNAVVIGAIGIQLVKKLSPNKFAAESSANLPVKMYYKSASVGGIIFGLGWAFTGACPGPMFVNIGAGYPVMIVVLLSAVLGALVHGLIAHRLPK